MKDELKLIELFQYVSEALSAISMQIYHGKNFAESNYERAQKRLRKLDKVIDELKGNTTKPSNPA